MGRKAKNPTDTTPSVVTDITVKEVSSTATDLVLVQQQHESAVRAVALQVGYELPADAVDAALIERDIRANMQRSVEAVLQVGKALLVLKTACAHGEFTERIESLGISYRVAAKFMQSAKKIPNVSISAHLKAIGNHSKLFELLILDDEQIEEFALDGTVNGVPMDGVDKMSTTELRRSLREAQAQAEVKDRLLTAEKKRNTELSSHIMLLTPDEKLEEMKKEATGIGNAAQGHITGMLRQAFIAIKEQAPDVDHAAFFAGLLGDISMALINLRTEYNLPDTATVIKNQFSEGFADWRKAKALRAAEAEAAKATAEEPID